MFSSTASYIIHTYKNPLFYCDDRDNWETVTCPLPCYQQLTIDRDLFIWFWILLILRVGQIRMISLPCWSKRAIGNFDLTVFVCKFSTFGTMSPLTVVKIFQMSSTISVSNYTFLAILSSCWFCHHFDSSSHYNQQELFNIQ